MMKSQANMNQLNDQSLSRKKLKHELDIQKKVNHPNKDLKRIKDLLAITMVRQVTHQTSVGAMGKKNSMENATIAINMVIRLMNAKRNQDSKANVTNVINMDTIHQNVKPRY